MSQEELRRERQETVEELRRTEDISGKSSWVSRGVSRAFGWRTTFGGVLAPSYTSGDNTDRDGAAPDSLDHTWEEDVRLFANVASASGKTRVYVRVKTTATQNSRISQSIRRADYIQPTFDLLYLQRQIRAGGWRHHLTFGRQFVMVERGIAFGLAADGLRYETLSRRHEIQLFFLIQNPGDDNIDIFSPGPGRTKRWFYGAEWKIKLHPSHTAGVFGLVNLDRNDESPDAAGQRHQLDSTYYGIGLDGRVIGNMKYWTQYVRETGRTYPNGGAAKIDIAAHALDAGIRYFFRTPTAPSFYAQYASGSGDKDAAGPGANSTSGGSTAGKDERFIGFGGLNLGYALAPQLTNLRAVKLGMSIKPFAWTASRSLGDFSVQPSYTMFRRDVVSGATSDPAISTAAGASRKIGEEFDLTVAWKAAVDIAYQLKFGRFNPSAAYPNRASENYMRLKFSLDL